MADMMQFPETWEEYEEQYGFPDKEEIYTNGSRLIQSFRVKQWLDHIKPKTGKWIDWLGKGNEWECSVCKCSIESHGSIAYRYCPMCGARMNGGKQDD